MDSHVEPMHNLMTHSVNSVALCSNSTVVTFVQTIVNEQLTEVYVGLFKAADRPGYGYRDSFMVDCYNHPEDSW